MEEDERPSNAAMYAVCFAICIGAMWIALLIVAGAR